MKLYHHMHKIWLLTLLEKYRVYKLAAAESQLTQSALTQNISNLEKVFGNPLVAKNRGVVELTEFGKRLVDDARPILDQIDNLHDPDRETSGVVRIGAYDSLAQNFVSKVILELSKSFPKAKFQIETGRSSEIRERVNNGKLDFGFTIDNDAPTTLDKDDIFDIHLGLFTAIKNKDIAPEQLLASSPLISVSYSNNVLPDYFNEFINALPSGETPKEPEITFSSFDAIVEALNDGDSVGILPDIIGCTNPNLAKIWGEHSGPNEHGKHKAVVISRPMVKSQIKSELINLLRGRALTVC